MTLQEIIFIMDNRLINLTETRKAAVSSGLIDQITLLDADILTTSGTIQQLNAALTAGIALAAAQNLS